MLRRLVQFVPTFLLGTILAFGIINAAPGDFLTTLRQNPRVTPTQVNMLRERFGLDKSVPVQYARWLGNLVQGNLGISFQYNRPVGELIWTRAWNSLILVLISTVVLYLVAIPIGVYGAVHPYGFGDRVLSFISYLWLGIPSFFFGLLAIFALVWLRQRFGWSVPISGKISTSLPDNVGALRHAWDVFLHALIPSVILVLRSISSESRYIRGQMLETLNQDYIRTARAKGLTSNRVTYKHAFRVAVLPQVAVIGALLPGLLSGAGFIEVVFSWPGLTPMLLDALANQDVYIIMSTTALSTVLYMVGNLLGDLALAAVDPRIRYN